ncbi:hypothetical protein N836_17340 [Leptolyngbya sp. Heron Island J]|nr:hypothetical protein N836_17340 [Leptolyngbya sp. Heron Island J]
MVVLYATIGKLYTLMGMTGNLKSPALERSTTIGTNLLCISNLNVFEVCFVASAKK